MTKLPRGWVAARLQELAGCGQYGWTTRACAKGATKFLRTTDITKGAINWDGVPYCEEAPSDPQKYALREGDILISRAGSVGFSALMSTLPDEPAVFASYLIRFLPDAEIASPRFLAHFLRSPDYWAQVTGAASGIALANVNAAKLAAFEVLVAPLREQGLIADRLDALLARVDACRERLDRVPAILKRFRQSVLSAATSGELTREWRDQQSGEDGPVAWNPMTLESLCKESKVITYGVIKLGEETRGGVPCLRTSNVRWLRIDIEGIKRIAPALSADYARTVLSGGEVLVNVRGTLGGVAVATADMCGWNVSREVAVIPVDTDKVESRFLAFWIGADASQGWLSKVEKGVAYTGINIEDLRTLPIALPLIEEQREIVRRVEELLALADQIEQRYEKAAEAVERLTPSILAKAFRGELVPQDPNDEPAATLLARLRDRPGTVELNGKEPGRGRIAKTRLARNSSDARAPRGRGDKHPVRKRAARSSKRSE